MDNVDSLMTVDLSLKVLEPVDCDLPRFDCLSPCNINEAASLHGSIVHLRSLISKNTAVSSLFTQETSVTKSAPANAAARVTIIARTLL